MSTFDSPSDYNVQQYPWFNPHVVIRAMSGLAKIYGSHVEDKREFKLAREMFDAAIALLGAYEIDSSNKYFLQPNFQSTSPDVMAAKQVEKNNLPILLELNQIEIVSMNEYAGTDDIVEFLKKTKLSPKKSYSEKTLILLTVNRKIQVDRQRIAAELNKLNPKPTIYILGKMLGENDEWTIFSPWPDLTKFVVYSLSKTIKKFVLPGSITLHLGLQEKISYSNPEELVTTVQKLFNINESDVQKYKKI